MPVEEARALLGIRDRRPARTAAGMAAGDA
jgi:hypothetical protein